VQHPFLDSVLPVLNRLVGDVAAATTAVNATGDTDGVVPDPSGLLVALSGGPDSVALLRAAHTWARAGDRPLAAVHLNHLLRGPDAATDERFCRDLCAELGVPLHVERADPRPVAKRRGLGLEEAGRVLRRRTFARVLDGEPDLVCVATGHHRDDQIETVIMRLFRGTGIGGLAAIRPREGRIIHPLLAVARTDVLEFLTDVGQPFRQDATNLTGSATRSRVRRELLPLARDIFGATVDRAPARLAELVADADRYIAAAATRAYREAVGGEEDPLRADSLRVDALLAVDPVLARRVLREFVATHAEAAAVAPSHTAPSPAVEAGEGSTPPPGCLEMKHVVELLAWLRSGQSGQSLDLPGGWRAVREFEHLRLESCYTAVGAVSPAESFRILVAPAPSLPATETDPESGGIPAGPRETQDGWELTVPADALRGAVRVRNWRPGDRIAAFGLGGHKKVGDLFQEHRVPRAQRSRALVVEDETGILWVPGVAQAERTRLLPSTRKAVTIRIVPRTPAPAPNRADEAP